MGDRERSGLTVGDEWHGTVATVTVTGEVDMGTAGELAARLRDVARKAPSTVIVDLGAVGFLDCSAVYTFLQARESLPAGCAMILRNPQETPRRVFTLTGLDNVLPVD